MSLPSVDALVARDECERRFRALYRHVDTHDVDAAAATVTPDARIVLPAGNFAGREEFRAGLMKRAESAPGQTLHALPGFEFVVNGDGAEAEGVMLMFNTADDGHIATVPTRVGTYRVGFTFSKEDGWLISALTAEPNSWTWRPLESIR